MPKKPNHKSASQTRTKTAQVNLRLSDEGRDLLDELQQHLGLSQVGTVEYSLRKVARTEGLNK